MRKTSIYALALLMTLGVGAVLTCTSVRAQNRTYVSKTGNDANDCFGPATACATFPRAISQATARGEVLCLDSGFFGALNITFSISINCGENTGQTGFNFSSVILPANGVAVIDGIDIDMRGFAGSGTALSFTGAGTLKLKNSTIRNSGNGINFTPNGNANLVVTNTALENNSNLGLLIQPSGSSAVKVDIDGLQATGNVGGVLANAPAGTTIDAELRNSLIAQNSNYGLVSSGAGGVSAVFLDSSSVSNNAQIGVYSTGANSFVLVSKTTIARNSIGWAFASGGGLFTFGNNVVNSVSAFGGPSASIGLQ